MKDGSFEGALVVAETPPSLLPIDIPELLKPRGTETETVALDKQIVTLSSFSREILGVIKVNASLMFQLL
jgi:hypothetical protein